VFNAVGCCTTAPSAWCGAVLGWYEKQRSRDMVVGLSPGSSSRGKTAVLLSTLACLFVLFTLLS
jgi:hypothetical protein